MMSTLPQAPPPDAMEVARKANILDISKSGAARVLTIHEFRLFQCVLPKELLNQSWQQAQLKAKLAPNITKIIARFNEISYWVATEIVIQRDPKLQRKTLHRFIKIAKVRRKFLENS